MFITVIRVQNTKYIQKFLGIDMLYFESFCILNEDVVKSNPDMLPPDTKLPLHAEVLDFTKNIGAMTVKRDNNIIQMSCEASDYDIHYYYKDFWGIFPKGKIHFNFVSHDYMGYGEDREIAGSRYVSDTGKYKLLIIND